MPNKHAHKLLFYKFSTFAKRTQTETRIVFVKPCGIIHENSPCERDYVVDVLSSSLISIEFYYFSSVKWKEVWYILSNITLGMFYSFVIFYVMWVMWVKCAQGCWLCLCLMFYLWLGLCFALSFVPLFHEFSTRPSACPISHFLQSDIIRLDVDSIKHILAGRFCYGLCYFTT